MKFIRKGIGLGLGTLTCALIFAVPVVAQESDPAKPDASKDADAKADAAKTEDTKADAAKADAAKADDKKAAAAETADTAKADATKESDAAADKDLNAALEAEKARRARTDTRNLRAEMKRMKERLEDLENRLTNQGKKQVELEKKADKITIKDDSSDFRVYWNGKLTAESKKAGFKIRLGGRIHAEAAFFDRKKAVQNAVGPIDDGFQLRRVRISLFGTLYKYVEYKTQYEFTRGTSSFRDIYVGLKSIPYIGTIRFGQQKEPFNLEQMSSTNDTPFIERGPTADLHTQRNTGVRILNHYKNRLAWSFGVFRSQDAFGDAVGQDGGDYNYTGRITGAPIYGDDGRRVVHLGIAYSRRKPLDGMERFRSRPRVNIAPRFVDTGNFSAEHIDQYGAEFAAVLNSLSIQGELVYDHIDSRGGARERFWGAYGYVTYFLTGEHRNYRGSVGDMVAVKLKENFDPRAGKWGAFELGFRVGYIDLDSGNINGGKSSDYTFALNWYFIKESRLMINYVRTNLEGVGETDAINLRFQVVF